MGNSMKAAFFLILIAAIHIAFLFGAYGTGLFGLASELPSTGTLIIWLGISSTATGYVTYKVSYGWVKFRLPWLFAPMLAAPFTILFTAVSTYIGVLLAINTFGV